jgi:hypothetical protein
MIPMMDTPHERALGVLREELRSGHTSELR